MKVTETDRRARPEAARLSVWMGSDGWRHRQMDWPQPAGVAPRGSLVFAGGRGDFIEKYIEPLVHWHARGWQVSAFDWRGQGGSAGSIVGGHLDSFDPLVADGAAMLGRWMAESPGPHVAVAHSMGAHLLLRVLAEHRPALAAAVLVAPMLGINTAPVPSWLARAAASLLTRVGWRERRAWKEALPQAPTGRIRQANLTSCAERYADELWWKAREPGFDLGPPSWGWFHAAFRSMARPRAAELASIRTPILLLGTERDRLVSPAAILRAARLLPCAELTMFPDAAHELLREADSVRLQALARIDAFLAVHAAA
ncbi:MAG TPA: alpha/beta hydrolase [Allosphingosinicella sp.]|nr:alpha/beta hydrolase [Allosphingosinicella sp.]